MITKTLVSAFALAASMSAFGQMGMMTPPDAKSSKPRELMSFIEMDAYKKVSAPDAYILTTFIGDLPGNVQTAVLRGLARIANEASDLKMKNQTAANAMGPMGDSMSKMDSSDYKHGERSFEQISADPMAQLSYADTIKLLQISQDETDRGLIQGLFTYRPFTESLIPTVNNERELDALQRYVRALAMSTQPTRLKYTSLAPHTYAGLPSGWSSLPWPGGR